MKKIIFSFIFFILLATAPSIFPSPTFAVGTGEICGLLSNTCDKGLTCVDFGTGEKPTCVKNGTLDKGDRCTNQNDIGTDGDTGACKNGLICTQLGESNFKTCNASEEIGLTPPPKPPCAIKDQIPCESFNTGLGEIKTDAGGFISAIFRVILSVSGGIALLLIIRAGYKIMTSQGREEAVKEGREQLIAALVGLLFLIFSLVLLQVIGVDILNIPGIK